MKCSFSDGLPEDCQKTSRRLLEDLKKTTRRPLAVFWQSSNSMIQGNFYKRLHFYMDSCAISPVASLFVEYTEKKTAVFQIQLELWINMTLCFWLMYPPPPFGKVGFCPSCNFSNLFPPKWLRMTWNGQFCPICNFSNLFPPKWLRMTWNGQFCPICNFSNLFPPKWLRMTWNGQFCLICNFSNLFPLKCLRMANFAQFATFPIFSYQSGSE